MSTTVLGYPRIGKDRELKRATEAYWAGDIDAAALRETAAKLRVDVWTTLRDAGLDQVPSNTFSLYDQVLDTAVLVGAVPERFRSYDDPLDRYFAMARGDAEVAPLEMTKWFDTNYHYLVPELDSGTHFALTDTKPLDEYAEARAAGIDTRPVVVGPLSFLLLAKPSAEAPEGFRPLSLIDGLVEVYAELLGRLAETGASWVELDEPVLAADRTPEELEVLRMVYGRLAELTGRPKIALMSYFGDAGDALHVVARLPVEGIGLDLVAGSRDRDRLATAGPSGKTLFAGLVDGRNVWRTDLQAAMSTAASLLGSAGELVITTSCSLQHVPLDLDDEPDLDPRVRGLLAFARQKVDEVAALGRGLTAGRSAIEAELAGGASKGADFRSPEVRARMERLGELEGRSDFADRTRAQRSRGELPPLPTTTIGSFPQTAEVRQARAAYRSGNIDDEGYQARMRAEVDRVIALQEDIGLDVLVHGEPERNDMVQYFAEQLDGYAATRNGWVQSYGSRYVRPPILYGDLSRPEPITVGWTTYAQSRTAKPVKGMLTGPVTMLAWSFVRDDQPLVDTARQVALALRDEVDDLERAGIHHIPG